MGGKRKSINQSINLNLKHPPPLNKPISQFTNPSPNRRVLSHFIQRRYQADLVLVAPETYHFST